MESEWNSAVKRKGAEIAYALTNRTIDAIFENAHSSKQDLNGVIGGGQIGLNYQFTPNWVLGFEFDFQGSDERKSSTVSDPFGGTQCIALVTPPNAPPICTASVPVSGTATTTYDAKIDWFGTARGRLGFLVTDQLLLYATGGLAPTARSNFRV